jgi:hypothetical protein
MTNNYFAIALVGAHSLGVAIHAENIDKAFEVAEHHLQERHPKSDVIVQAVQRITNESAGCNSKKAQHSDAAVLQRSARKDSRTARRP